MVKIIAQIRSPKKNWRLIRRRPTTSKINVSKPIKIRSPKQLALLKSFAEKAKSSKAISQRNVGKPKGRSNSNSPEQLEIWDLVERRKKATSQRKVTKPTDRSNINSPEQLEIWNLIEKADSKSQKVSKPKGKPKKPKTPEELFKEKHISKIHRERDIINSNLEKHQKKFETNENYKGFWKYEKVRIQELSKLRLWNHSKKMLKRINLPISELSEITSQLNSGIQKIFVESKTKPNAGQIKLLSDLNSLTERCVSNSSSELAKRDAYLDIIKRTRQLQVSLYKTYSSRYDMIKQYNNLLDYLFRWDPPEPYYY